MYSFKLNTETKYTERAAPSPADQPAYSSKKKYITLNFMPAILSSQKLFSTFRFIAHQR